MAWWWRTKNGMLSFSRIGNLISIYEKEICLISKVISFMFPNSKVVLDSHGITLDFVGICVYFTNSFFDRFVFSVRKSCTFFTNPCERRFLWIFMKFTESNLNRYKNETLFPISLWFWENVLRSNSINLFSWKSCSNWYYVRPKKMLMTPGTNIPC